MWTVLVNYFIALLYMNKLYKIADESSRGPGLYITSGGLRPQKNIDNENYLRGSDIKLSADTKVSSMKHIKSEYNFSPDPISTKTSKTCSYEPSSRDMFHPTLKPTAYVDQRIGSNSRFDSR